MSVIRISDLAHRAALEREVRTSDGGGGASVTWELVAEVWAAIMPVSGREHADADALHGEVSHEVWVRYRDDVTPDMRLRIDTRVFDVRAVLNAGDEKHFLKLSCLERVT